MSALAHEEVPGDEPPGEARHPSNDLLTLRTALRRGLPRVEVLRPGADAWEEVRYLRPRRCYCGEHDGAHPAPTTPTTKAER